MDMTLTYAVPVHVLNLGPNLTAYFETLSAINAFRCCNRFGKHAALTKLPRELVDRVETFLITGVRKSVSKQWRRTFHCFQGECWELDYLSNKEKREIMAHHDGPLGEELAAELKKCSGKELDEIVESYVEDKPEVHDERIAAWQNLVASMSKDLDRVRKHSGVGLWISHVRVAPLSKGCSPPPERH